MISLLSSLGGPGILDIRSLGLSGSGIGPIGMEQIDTDGISDPYIMMVIMTVCLLCRYRDSRGISKFRFESPGGTQGAPQGGGGPRYY